MRIVKGVMLTLFSFIFFITLGIITAPKVRQLLYASGVVQQEIMIAGTGSMYPTFPKGSGGTDIIRAKETVAWPKMQVYPAGVDIFSIKFLQYKLQHGDIVEFENEKTREITQKKYGDEAGFVKRIIGLPGDTIMLRDGFLYLNGEILNEPYTAKPRSTYGGDFLPDCKTSSIPEGFVFVMGDNRKASLDSRFQLGLIKLSDIHYVLPWDKQDAYKGNFRDTKEDTSLANKPTLDGEEFVKMLNDKRKEKNLKPLKYNILLSNSAKIRGNAIIKSNDFSVEATKSGVPLEKAIKQSGYQNIIFAESYSRGFYEASEILDNYLEFPDIKQMLMSTQYQDLGIAPVIGDIEGCPVQVVVTHLGGYVPPNYAAKDIENWQKLVDNLESVLPSWKNAINSDGIDQEKLKKLITLIEERLGNAKLIVLKMKANLWLNDSEKQKAAEDRQLSESAQSIISELNKH